MGNLLCIAYPAPFHIDEKADRILIQGKKGQTAVEDYLFARYAMYAQVYSHKKNQAARGHLASIVKRAKFAWLKIKIIVSWMTLCKPGYLPAINSALNNINCLDDVLLTYHIKRWCEAKDAILADLAPALFQPPHF